MSVRYTAFAIQDLPYPHGLGKEKYKSLKSRMQGLLGSKWCDQAANEALFWEPQYQAILNEELSAEFDGAGAIEDVARDAFEKAKASSTFAMTFADNTKAFEQYTESFPPRAGRGADPMYANWLWSPPELSRQSTGEVTIVDGRHRLSYLRARVQPSDPDFPVLVRYYED